VIAPTTATVPATNGASPLAAVAPTATLQPAADGASPSAIAAPTATLQLAADEASPPAVVAPTATMLPVADAAVIGVDTTPPPPPPTVALTEAVVAARLAARAARLNVRCAMAWIVLDLTVQRGRATLAAINGMPFTERDPIHACVREQLRGLTFPRADKAAEFSLTIDLSPKDSR
jgi:hypothetical protein